MNYLFETSGALKTLTQQELLAADADSDSFIIVCNRGILEDKRPYWAYISVKPSKYHALLSATKARANIALEDYGEILRYGFDAEVPAKIKEEMRKEYNYDEHYMEHLAQDIKSARKVFLKEQQDRKISDIVTMLKNKKIH